MSNPLSEASKKKLSRHIASALQLPELDASYLLDGQSGQSKASALKLVLTLKHYANPLSPYPTDKTAEEEIKTASICLADPEMLHAGSAPLLESEKLWLSDLLRSQMDKTANEIMAKEGITQREIQIAVDDHLKNLPLSGKTEDEPDIAWWNSLNQDQQAQIESNYKSLNAEQQKQLQNRIQQQSPHASSYGYSSPMFVSSYTSYYHMSFMQAELNYLTIRATVDFVQFAIWGVMRGAERNLRWNTGSGISRNSRDEGQAMLIIAAVAIFIAMAISALVATVYSIKKVFNSFRNIFHGDKILRSIYRLAGTIGGAYLGMFAGAAVGAMLGSVVPGIGTAVGALIGTSFGAGIGAGIGSLAAKWSAKLMSYRYYQDKKNPANPERTLRNPTNPDKWNLTPQQVSELSSRGLDVAKVDREIERIRDRKISSINGSYFFTPERQEKEKLNWALKEIKKGNIYSFYPPRLDLLKTQQMPTPSAPIMFTQKSAPERTSQF